MTNRCANCRRPDAEERELAVRRDPSTEVYLCEQCYSALEAEFVWESTTA